MIENLKKLDEFLKETNGKNLFMLGMAGIIYYLISQSKLKEEAHEIELKILRDQSTAKDVYCDAVRKDFRRRIDSLNQLRLKDMEKTLILSKEFFILQDKYYHK